ncbi:tetratricopeptide repeat protein 17 [Biomphalaria glabrata]|nr:tetratricopeptide repeat protein 17-like; partial [Biomphalaria glabrata]
MACDLPCMSYMALYVISMHIVNSNSRSSSSHHWKLNLAAGKVEPAKAESSQEAGSPSTKSTSDKYNNSIELPSEEVEVEVSVEDRMMGILTNKEVKGGEWVVTSPDDSDRQYVNIKNLKSQHCDRDLQHPNKCSEFTDSNKLKVSKTNPTENSDWNKSTTKLKPLNCGKKVNSTQYDHLRGISERHQHTHIPEPDVAMVFQTNHKSSEVDMNDLEQKLRKAKRDLERDSTGQKQQSAQVYNLIGNFWRIKGNTQTSIECFRKALSISPEDPEILLNLARVLFNLQYLDDAIFLARRSLHLQPSGQNAWLQHYTLGEILKSYGHPQEAAMHFNQALLLNPGFQPARSHLRDLDTDSHPSVTHLTLFIILFLVVGVLFGIVTSIESNFQDTSLSDSSKVQQRHFNRAMAMRSIKLGINPRMCRIRKTNS